MKRLDLNKILLTSPCSTDWEGMRGDDKTRFCDDCQTRVYNLSAMTRREVESLVRETNGRFCARVIRDADGSVITATEKAGLNLIRLRTSKFASAMVTAALSLSPVVAATNTNPPRQVQAEKESKRDLTAANAQGGTANIRGTVFDPKGAVIVRATLTLINEETNEQFITTTSEEGVYQFASLPAGIYELKVESSGFVTQIMTDMELQPNIERQFDVTLQPGHTQGEIVIVDDTLSSESLDTIRIPEMLLHPIKAIQLRVNKPNKPVKPTRKKQTHKQ